MAQISHWVGGDGAEDFNCCKCQTQKVRQPFWEAVDANVVQRLLNPESPPLPQPQNRERFDDYIPESRGLIRAAWCTSLIISSFTLLYRDLFKLTGTEIQIQDLCLTIAGLSEILIRVLSYVYEMQLRFVSADGCIIF